MPTPTTVIQGVQARLLVTVAVTAIVGDRIYLGQAPETQAPPYIVVEYESETPTYRFSGAMAKTTRLTIACFSRVSNSADALARIVMGVFDPRTSLAGLIDDLGIVGESTTRIAQTGYRLAPEPVLAPEADIVFAGRIGYEIMTARSW